MIMLKKFLFADLDDTLFQSGRKCPEGAPLTPMAYLKDGTAHSFATTAQKSFLMMMEQEMSVIPVTARNADAFSRVRWPFTNGAVINYGGVILQPDGAVDECWLSQSRARAAQTLPMLERLRAELSSIASTFGVTLKIRIIEDFAVPFYLCAKSEEGQETALDAVETPLRQWCEACTLEVAVHRNGNNLSVLPLWLDKRHAVEHLTERLRREHGEIVTFGMGDSLSDLAFMSACDYAVVPKASQINRQWGSA